MKENIILVENLEF